MVKNYYKSLKKSITIFTVSLVSLFLIGNIISNVNGIHLRDVLFIEGIIMLMLTIFSSISGSPQSYSLQEFGQINPQYFASMFIETTIEEKNRVVSATNIDVDIDLVSISIMLGSIVALIVSYIL